MLGGGALGAGVLGGEVSGPAGPAPSGATVTHKLRLPDGSVPIRADIAIRLIGSLYGPQEAHVAGNYSIGGVSRPVIDSTGTWSANLEPNAWITPAGTMYEITERFGGQPPVRLYIVVPSLGGEVQDLLVSAPTT
jgi:hypothetical protein